jgi:hypothetical protein
MLPKTGRTPAVTWSGRECVVSFSNDLNNLYNKFYRRHRIAVDIA